MSLAAQRECMRVHETAANRWPAGMCRLSGVVPPESSPFCVHSLRAFPSVRMNVTSILAYEPARTWTMAETAPHAT